MDLNSINKIVERCNLINDEIGLVENTAPKDTSIVAIKTTGGYLDISIEAIQEQSNNCLLDYRIETVASTFRKK